MKSTVIIVTIIAFLSENILFGADVNISQTTALPMQSTAQITSLQDKKTNENQGGSIDITNLSFQEICTLFQITPKNCSCSVPFMKELCDFLNITQVEVKFACDTVSNEGIAIANIISSVVGLFGNGLVIGFTIFHRKDSSRFRHLISSLAIADFLFAVILLLISIPQTWTCLWVYGSNMCKFLRASLAACANIAVGFIVIIALDRFFGIMHPFNKFMNKTRLWLIVCLNVLLGIASVVPPLVVLQLGEFSTCVEGWGKGSSRVYTWYLFLFYYILPIVSLAILYGIMMVWLRKSYTQNQVLSDDQLRARYQKNKNIMIMLISILVLFAILVLPNRVVWIISDQYGFNNIKNMKVIRLLKMLSEIPYGLHAAVNPIIYSVVDMKFKQHLKAFLFGRKLTKDSVYSLKTSSSALGSNMSMDSIKKKSMKSFRY